MVQEDYRPGRDLVVIPYEFLPLPEKGAKVIALDRDGKEVAEAEILKVVKSANKTHLVHLLVPTGLAQTVRAFRIPQKADSLVCRCEEVTVEEIEKAIDEGYTDYEELRRYLRIGMGPCGGRTCRVITQGILARKTKRNIKEIGHSTFRPPSMPIKFDSIIRGEINDEK